MRQWDDDDQGRREDQVTFSELVVGITVVLGVVIAAMAALIP